MADNNPFDVTVLNEVRPTYVGPPVEDISQARQYLTKTGRENQEAKILLEGAFADTINSLSEDPDGINLVKQHADDFTTATKDMINRGDYAYMGPAIRNMAAKFAGDNRIKNRQTRLAEWQGKRDAMLENDNIDEDAKQLFSKQQYSFNGNDDLGTSSPTKFFTPFKRVDVNKELLDTFKQFIPSGSSVTGYKIVNDRDGSKYAIMTESGTIYVSADEIKQAFKGTINNNPALRNYLFQTAAIGKNYDNVDGAVTAIEDAVQNPELYDNVISKASNDLAEALAYRRSDVKTTLQNIALQRDTDTNGPINPNTVYGAGINVETKHPSVDEVKTAITTSKSQLAGLFGDDPGINVTPEESDYFNQLVSSNNGDAIREFAKQKGISPTKLHEYVSKSQALQLDQSLATSKLDNASKAAMYDDKGRPKYSLIGNVANDDNVQALSDMGFDYKNNSGTFDIDKVMSNNDDIEAGYWQISKDIAAMTANQNQRPTPEMERRKDTLARAMNYVTNIRKKYSKEYDRYNNELNSIVEAKNTAHDEIKGDRILGYSVKARKGDYQALEQIFGSIATLKSLKVHDSTNNRLEPDYFDNLDDIKIDNILISPTKAGDTGSSSWVIPYTATDKKGKKIHDELRIPIESDKGGVEQQIFTDIVKNSPYYRAGRLVDKVILNNIEGEYNIPGYNGFNMTRDARNGKITYSTPSYKSTTRDDFTKALSMKMVGKELEYMIGPDAGKVVSVFDNIKPSDYANDQEYTRALGEQIYDELNKGSFDMNAISDDEAGALISQIISSVLNARR